MFTREVIVQFVAPLEDVNSWLADSPGTAGVMPEVSGAVRTYSIDPGGGAQFAEVKVDELRQAVRIWAYWS